jgi:acyl-CoA synthetase (AMP-forming)/AMP-acid ligase II
MDKRSGERVIPSYVEFEGMNFPQVLDLQAKSRPGKVLFVHGKERVTFVDDQRREVPLGAPGEIAIKGKNPLIAYYKNPELTRKTIDGDGFFYTGDLGRIDETGYLIFTGRKTDMIISGGFNVYPLEVEGVLYRLPFVALTAVIGLPDPELGEVVCACLVLQEGMKATSEAVIVYCRGKLANYKVPKRVEFMDTLPTALGTNKIKKSTLVEILKEVK